jgi:short-subunit dehydrogenase
MLAQSGFLVAATMRRPEVEQELQKIPGVKLYKLDVTDQAMIKSAVHQVVSDHGRIDVLINNAGYGVIGPAECIPQDKVIAQFKTNVFGLIDLTQLVLPIMRQQGFGRILNVSSVAGRVGIPMYSIYNASKFAVEGFTESLQYELRDTGIEVALVEPGAIHTDFHSRSGDYMAPEAGSVYEKDFKRIQDSNAELQRIASSADFVAKKIRKILQKKCLKLRYPVGGGAPWVVFARAILPDWILFSLIKLRLR